MTHIVSISCTNRAIMQIACSASTFNGAAVAKKAATSQGAPAAGLSVDHIRYVIESSAGCYAIRDVTTAFLAGTSLGLLTRMMV